MADDLGEKTEEATPRRRQESRSEGQVVKSQDLTGAIVLIAGTLALAAAASWMLGEAKLLMAAVLEGTGVADPLDIESTRDVMIDLAVEATRIAAPVILIVAAGALLAQFGQVGWLISPKAIRPKLSKLNPLSGFKKILGLQSLVKAGLDSTKIAIVATVTVFTVRQYGDRILLLPYLGVLEVLSIVGATVFNLALRLLLVILLLGIIDYMYQKWKNSQDLKMSKQEVKDEMKQTEGDPETKKRRMRMQQQIAMQRISSTVPKADVIVTNPEHISIAIQYDQATMNAPRVVAKGADFLAIRIRQIAMKHGIPIIERKPLARALYREVGVGQEIPPDYYSAVAEVLAYVYRLSGRRAG